MSFLNAYYSAKEANLKRLYTVGFQLYDIVEKAKLEKKFNGCDDSVGQRKIMRWNTKDF